LASFLRWRIDFFIVLIATTDTGASPMPVATGDPVAGNTSCQTDAFAATGTDLL
jgi:hypothetical protein